MATELKNIEVKGVKIPIIYEHNTQLPLFYVQISFKGAGGINNGKLYGLSEITSAILNEGTKKLGSTRFSQQLEQKALSLDVKSGLETIRFTLSGTAKEYQEGIKYLKDLIKDPNFTPGALKKVKQIALNSLLERENNFDYQAGKNLNAILFKNTPLEYPLSGTKETLKKITLRNIETFYKNSLDYIIELNKKGIFISEGHS
ncbi:MAG: insulinase family protein, partial [Helicobacter sp.]|nr:insulinase family protein [Helicobacter sp.]